MRKFDITSYNNLIKGSFNNKLNKKDNPYKIDNSSAGIKIEFSLITSYIELSYISEKNEYCRQDFGACIMKGLIYSIMDIDGRILAKGNFVSKNLNIEERHKIFCSNQAQLLNCEIYLPHMVAVEKIFIYADDETDILPTINKKNAIYYLGGLNTLGSGCTFQTSTMPTIVSSLLKAETYIMASKSKEIYNEKLFPLIKKNNPIAVVVETYAPATDYQYMKSNLYNYIKNLVDINKETIFVFWEFPFVTGSNSLRDKHNVYLSVKDKISEEKKNNLYFLDSSNIFDQKNFDNFTISPNFINDNANYILAENIANVLKILRGQ